MSAEIPQISKRLLISPPDYALLPSLAQAVDVTQAQAQRWAWPLPPSVLAARLWLPSGGTP